ncbi:MAG: glycosyltransferase family 39 protein [Oligosphaeraceae bacterium]
MHPHRRHLLLLLAITALALALRATVCLQLADTPAVASPGVQTDMATYVRLAHDVQRGRLPDHFDYQPFYYTALLPWLLPSDPQAATGPLLLAFQALAGAGAVLLTGLAAALAFGRRWAWVAALLLALSRTHLFYTPFALYEVLLSCWVALTLCLTLLAWRHDRWRDWLLAAAALALAALTRGNAILLLPLLAGAAILRRRHAWPRALALAAAIAAVASLPQLPYALRNAAHLGRWTGASTAGPKVLALGNTPEAPAAGLAYPLTYSKWVDDSDTARRSMLSHIADWALHHPLQFAELKFRTLLHFWDAAEIPNNVSIEQDGLPHSAVLRLPLLVPFGLIAPLALAGTLLLLRRRAATVRLTLLFLLILCAATIAFYMLARFRLASYPVLCVLAAGTVARLALPVRLHRRRLAPDAPLPGRLLAPALALAFAAAVVHGALPLYQFAYEADVHRLLTPDGTCAHFPGDTTLIHDHGPLPLGAGQQQPLAIPPTGLTVRKTFRLPDGDLRALLVGRPFTARLMVAGSPLPAATISHAGQTLPATPARRYAFSQFLAATLPHCQPDQDGNVTVTVTLAPPPAGQPAAAVVDLLRDYGRVQYLDGAGQPIHLQAEPFAEIQFSHRQ